MSFLACATAAATCTVTLELKAIASGTIVLSVLSPLVALAAILAFI